MNTTTKPIDQPPADALRAIRVLVAQFDTRCKEAEYTDVGDTWELLHTIYREAGGDTADLDGAEPSASEAPADAPAKQYMACPECGCTDVEITAWVKANGGANTNSESPAEYAYCPQCEVENLRDVDLTFVAELKPYKAG
jgi:hypothetical protein